MSSKYINAIHPKKPNELHSLQIKQDGGQISFWLKKQEDGKICWHYGYESDELTEKEFKAILKFIQSFAKEIKDE